MKYVKDSDSSNKGKNSTEVASNFLKFQFASDDFTITDAVIHECHLRK